MTLSDLDARGNRCEKPLAIASWNCGKYHVFWRFLMGRFLGSSQLFRNYGPIFQNIRWIEHLGALLTPKTWFLIPTAICEPWCFCRFTKLGLFWELNPPKAPCFASGPSVCPIVPWASQVATATRWPRPSSPATASGWSPGPTTARPESGTRWRGKRCGPWRATVTRFARSVSHRSRSGQKWPPGWWFGTFVSTYPLIT